jgi:hypothetical protein
VQASGVSDAVRAGPVCVETRRERFVCGGVTLAPWQAVSWPRRHDQSGYCPTRSVPLRSPSDTATAGAGMRHRVSPVLLRIRRRLRRFGIAQRGW